MNEIREKRWNPLFQEWVIIAESTSLRPWNGAESKHVQTDSIEFDPTCYLCAGNKRANGVINPDYLDTYSFVNDFASFSFDSDISNVEVPPFSKTEKASGICKVLVYSRNHSHTLSDLSVIELIKVFELWNTEFDLLSQNKAIKNVLIFENKGKIIGVSNPHPHGQLYATDFVPNYVQKIAVSFTANFEKFGEHLLQSTLKFEQKTKERVVCENEDWIIFVPFYAQFAYETLLIPKRFFQDIGHVLPHELISLAKIYKTILLKYDALFGFSLPNITTVYNAPLENGKDFNSSHFQFFIRFTPPLREADKLKYLAGFETGGGNIINPLAPEKAAKILGGIVVDEKSV
jgi:UDPglucose--hexose-1-phosphate uridylyltransferase